MRKDGELNQINVASLRSFSDVKCFLLQFICHASPIWPLFTNSPLFTEATLTYSAAVFIPDPRSDLKYDLGFDMILILSKPDCWKWMIFVWLLSLVWSEIWFYPWSDSIGKQMNTANVAGGAGVGQLIIFYEAKVVVVFWCGSVSYTCPCQSTVCLGNPHILHIYLWLREPFLSIPIHSYPILKFWKALPSYIPLLEHFWKKLFCNLILVWRCWQSVIHISSHVW